MAPGQGWPIRLDHCFMRVCLDHALGCRWDTVVQRPAIRNLTADQLARAVTAAEQILAQPGLLPAMNDASLAMRGHQRPRNTGVRLSTKAATASR